MALLQQLSLTQFKNYLHTEFRFGSRIVGITGKNGVGKTNLLDAIYYLCFTKSYFTVSDLQLVERDSMGFRVAGTFDLGQATPTQVTAVLRENGKKEISCGGQVYSRVSAHIGTIPAVIIAPDDIQIITGAPEMRRKMYDALLCQLDAEYLQQLMTYNKLLLQRNTLLKQMQDNPARLKDVLQATDKQLAEKGSFIYEKRWAQLTPYLQEATNHYHKIAAPRGQGLPDPVLLQYVSEAATLPAGPQAYLQKLQQGLAKDLVLGRTGFGIHRDDLQLLLHQSPFRQMASQGQRKSMLFALKLTEYEWLQRAKGFAPLLLLDDVFEKLDHDRMHNLLHEVCVE
ncbi:MAG: DNA replication and repair protein RecF, partial [Chitinophagaceae bacterium]|nr:DNA replication and repair protein RecF [Chitinophagaceae bacterium]